MTQECERIAYEKIWNVLQTIQEKRIAARDNMLNFSVRDFPRIVDGEVGLIINGLQSTDKILKIIDWTDAVDNFPSSFTIKVIPSLFDPYFSKIEKIITKIYDEDMEKEDKDLKEAMGSMPINPVVYRVDYSEKTREIRVNNLILSKPDFDSENEFIFSYLYKNPNKKISRQKLEKEMNRSIKKRFQDVVRDLGFRGDLKKSFFGISKTSILFRNPIRRKDLDELGIHWLSIKQKE